MKPLTEREKSYILLACGFLFTSCLQATFPMAGRREMGLIFFYTIPIFAVAGIVFFILYLISGQLIRKSSIRNIIYFTFLGLLLSFPILVFPWDDDTIILLNILQLIN